MHSPHLSRGFASHRGRFKLAFFSSVLLAASLLCGRAASTVVAWGDPTTAYGPNPFTNVISASVGCTLLGLQGDGKVTCLGGCYSYVLHPQPPVTDLATISSGCFFVLGLRSNGTVVAWGDNYFGEATVPAGLTGVVAVATGNRQSLALKSDGTVRSWGQHGDNVPAGLSNVIAISGSPLENYFHALALKSDGTVVAWGRNDYGETNVPAGLSNVIAVAAGGYHCLALKADRTVVAWGGQDSAVVTPPPGLSNVIAIAAGGYHSLVLKSDQTLVTWESSTHTNNPPIAVPPGLSNVIAISAGPRGSAAVVGPTPPIIVQQPESRHVVEGSGIAPSVLAYGTQPITYQWQKDGVDIVGATNYFLHLHNLFIPDSGIYGVVLSNSVGSTSVVFTITVGPSIRLLHSPVSQTVDAGTNVNLHVDVTGTAPLEYQWRKNLVNIPGAIGESLTLSNVQPADSGSYTVVAHNGAGNVISGAANLLVRSLTGPNISAHPQPVTAWEGAKALFMVSATGIAPLTYQWSKNGSPLGGATNATLAFNSLQSSDPGSYHVVVSDSSGSVPSASAALTLVTAPVRSTPPPGTVVSLGGPIVPPGINDAVAVSAGSDHGLALRSDGTVMSWGGSSILPGYPLHSVVPAGLSNVVAVAAGDRFSLALKTDGTLVSWGLAPSIPADLAGVTAIDAGGVHPFSPVAIALRADGTVVKLSGGTMLPGMENVVAVSAGGDTVMALKSDGTIAYSPTVNSFASPLLNNLHDAAAVSVGSSHYLVLKTNGTVLDYGGGSDPPNRTPPGLSNVVSIAAGGGHSLVLKNDGSVIGWNGPAVPVGVTNISAIAAGGFSLLITTNPPVPSLSARTMGDKVLLSAPISVSGYVLEAADSLASPFSPTDVSTNETVTGETNAVILGTPGASKFYRFKKVQ